MVLIEPTPSEKESSRRVNLTPEPKPKPSASIHGGSSAADASSDGFETASDGEFNVVDDNGDEHQSQRQQHEQPQSTAATDESLEAASCDESALVLSLFPSLDVHTRIYSYGMVHYFRVHSISGE
ncbi:hypothetical protein Acr_16g0005710 [Actinidia rufa]|uniref:Uncharacterized protein n=1 Tax=Actinidia rufa TaxID=165716 RepID=A0A7J0FZP5_9ERIC|nr:hypothetical protein Acr_16g0005710 [Actinidia rufa]